MLDYLDSLARATSLEDVWELHCAEMARFGFDRLIYGYTRFGTPQSLGAFEDALFLTNHDPAYVDSYVNNRMFLHGPLLRWARENVGACSWGALWGDRDSLSEEERRVVAFNQRMGVHAGYSISFHEPNPRAFGMIALAARPGLCQADVDEIWAVDGREIEAMNHMAHLKIRAMPQMSPSGMLSKRQCEVLEWVGAGKSNQDIAQILGVSITTVEKHLRLAREKLGVETTAQALLKASAMNQVFRV